MNPVQFKSLYYNIRANTVIPESDSRGRCYSTLHRVSIRSYRNANLNVSAAERSSLLSYLRRNRFSSHDRTAVFRAFNGKASVRQCQRTVEILLISGFASTGLQRYCDNNLGLDCSGFVNNYFLHEGTIPDERGILSYYSRGRNQKRIDFSDFRRKDVLIWCNNMGTVNNGSGSARHIAVIDTLGSNAGNELIATVVESTGTLGLVQSNYRFIKTSRDGVFRVFRPLKPNTRNHVVVVPVV